MSGRKIGLGSASGTGVTKISDATRPPFPVCESNGLDKTNYLNKTESDPLVSVGGVKPMPEVELPGSGGKTYPSR